jgi:hypothetical protein
VNGESVRQTRLRDWAALLLAVAICTAVNLVTIGVLYDAIRSPKPGVALSDNATQLLQTALGGIIGVLGAYLGFRAGHAAGEDGGRPPGPAPVSDESEQTAAEVAAP